MRASLLLLPAIACTFTKDADDSGATDGQIVNECDPVIRVPQALGAESTELAEAHAETFGADPEPFHVHYSWPSSDPSTSAAFLWRTDTDTLASVLEYGTGGQLTERVEGASFLYGGTATGPGNYRIHEVRLCEGLQPDTTYSYRVGGDGHWSQTYEFTTPPSPGTFDSFRVAMAGDSRNDPATWSTILQLMDAQDPDFILFSGDMVEIGPDQGDWDEWFDASGDVLARRAFVPAHGNHEFLAQHYFAQFALPNNEQWFHYRYGDLTLISLNDTVSDQAHLENEQVEYMNEVWANNPTDWKVATHHQTVFATCTVHGSYENLRAKWAPVFDAHEVDLVVAGHNHIYERSVPIRGGEQVDMADGTTYLVTGGAGAPLYTGTEPEWFGLVANPILHYAIADFTADNIHVVVRDLEGNVIDEFDKPR